MIFTYIFAVRSKQIPHITQIAAVEVGGSGKEFNSYVMPQLPMSDEALQMTRIVVSGERMVVRGEDVNPASIHDALDSFTDWLQQFSNVFLVAHNGRRFDFPVLTSALSHTNKLDAFCSTVSGYVDSLAVFKQAFPKMSSYKLEDLVASQLKEQYGAHDALEDVKALGKLLCMCTESGIVKQSFAPAAVHRAQFFQKERAKNIKSLEVLVGQGIMKMSLAENIAGSGLTLNHLRSIVNRQGEDGLRDIFTAKNCEGQPRVTNSKKLLDSVLPNLVSYIKQ